MQVKKLGYTVKIRFGEPCGECGEPVTRAQIEADEIAIAPYARPVHWACIPEFYKLRLQLLSEAGRMFDEEISRVVVAGDR